VISVNTQWELPSLLPSGWKEGTKTRTDAGHLRQLLEKHTANRLRFNELTRFMEWDGQRVEEVDARLLYVALQEKGYKANENSTVNALLAQARLNRFDPVLEYLRGIEENHRISPVDLEGTLSQILGISDPLHIKMVVLTMIAAVKRAWSPGCKVDTVLTLHSKEQGLGKSTFLETLAGKQFYCSSAGEGKDQILLLHTTWIYEMAELDSLTGSRDTGTLKNQITTATDVLRVPYGRVPEPIPRRSVICGTSNRKDFLRDSTGSRRFWVVPITRPIDNVLTGQVRDQLWKAAILRFRNGEQWWLDREEESAVEDSNKDFAAEHPFLAMLREWVRSSEEAQRPFTTALAIVASKCRNEGCIQPADEMKASDCLRELGFEKKRTTVDGIRGNYWLRAAQPARPGREVGQPKAIAAQAVDQPGQPDQPLEEKSGKTGDAENTGKVAKRLVRLGSGAKPLARQEFSADKPDIEVGQPVAEVGQRPGVKTNETWIRSAHADLLASGVSPTEQAVRRWLSDNRAPSINHHRIGQVLESLGRQHTPPGPNPAHALPARPSKKTS